MSAEGRSVVVGVLPRGDDSLPAVAMFGLLLFFTISLVYPSLAYPWHGVGVGAGVVVLAALAALMLRMPRSSAPTLTLLLGAAWLLVWGLAFARAPVMVLGREGMQTAALGFLTLLAMWALFAAWPEEQLFPAKAGDPSSQLSPFTILCGWLAVFLGLFALYGVWQSLGPAWGPKTFRALEADILLLPESDPSREGLLHAVRERRAAGTVGAPNVFASFCVAAVALAAGVCVAARTAVARGAFAACGVVALLAIVLSGSQGGVLSTIVASGVFAMAMLAWRLDARGIRRVLLAGGAAMILVILAFVGIKLLAPESESRWLGFSGVNQRLLYWQTALSIWRESPILGMGAGAFEVLYPAHRMAGSNETKLAHSWVFHHLAEVGALGLVLFLGICGAVAISAFRSLSRLKTRGEWAAFALVAGLLAAWMGLLAHGAVEYTLNHREGALLFFLLSGALAGGCRALAGGGAAAPVALRAVLAAAILLGGGLAVYRLQVEPARGAAFREEADALFQQGARPNEILSAARVAVELDPQNADYRELLGYYRLATGDRGGLRDFERAAEMNPFSARLRERLAVAHAEVENYPLAIEEQRAAVERHPLDAGHRMLLVDFLLRHGDVTAATEEFEVVRSLRLIGARESAQFATLEEKMDALSTRQ